MLTGECANPPACGISLICTCSAIAIPSSLCTDRKPVASQSKFEAHKCVWSCTLINCDVMRSRFPSCRTLLSRARPLVIFEHVADAAAMYGDEPEAPWDLLSELGYRIFSVTGRGPFT